MIFSQGEGLYLIWEFSLDLEVPRNTVYRDLPTQPSCQHHHPIQLPLGLLHPLLRELKNLDEDTSKLVNLYFRDHVGYPWWLPRLTPNHICPASSLVERGRPHFLLLSSTLHTKSQHLPPVREKTAIGIKNKIEPTHCSQSKPPLTIIVQGFYLQHQDSKIQINDVFDLKKLSHKMRIKISEYYSICFE